MLARKRSSPTCQGEPPLPPHYHPPTLPPMGHATPTPWVIDDPPPNTPRCPTPPHHLSLAPTPYACVGPPLLLSHPCPPAHTQPRQPDPLVDSRSTPPDPDRIAAPPLRRCVHAWGVTSPDATKPTTGQARALRARPQLLDPRGVFFITSLGPRGTPHPTPMTKNGSARGPNPRTPNYLYPHCSRLGAPGKPKHQRGVRVSR